MADAQSTKFKCTLRKMTGTTSTVLWNESATLPELAVTIEHEA